MPSHLHEWSSLFYNFLSETEQRDKNVLRKLEKGDFHPHFVNSRYYTSSYIIQVVWLLTQSKSHAKRCEVRNFLLWLKDSLEYLLPFLVKIARISGLPYEGKFCKLKNHCIWNKVSDKSTWQICGMTDMQRYFWVLKSISHVSCSLTGMTLMCSVHTVWKSRPTWKMCNKVSGELQLKQEITDLYQMRVTKDVNQYKETGKNNK